jgi:hypothetical protein
MNYGDARELATGGWHYTIRNDNEIWRHHCCRECDYSVRGHPTKEDAYRCVNEYARKQASRWQRHNFGGWRDCKVCGWPTREGATWNGAAPGWPENVPLCEAHLNDACVLDQVETVRYLMYS